jgi:hypothetical protein
MQTTSRSAGEQRVEEDLRRQADDACASREPPLRTDPACAVLPGLARRPWGLGCDRGDPPGPARVCRDPVCAGRDPADAGAGGPAQQQQPCRVPSLQCFVPVAQRRQPLWSRHRLARRLMWLLAAALVTFACASQERWPAALASAACSLAVGACGLRQWPLQGRTRWAGPASGRPPASGTSFSSDSDSSPHTPSGQAARIGAGAGGRRQSRSGLLGALEVRAEAWGAVPPLCAAARGPSTHSSCPGGHCA